MNTTAATYTRTELPAVTLGNTTYRAELQIRDGVHPGLNPMVWLYGPRGAVYFLREYMGEDDGLRQVISWKSGAPLRVKGNEVRVFHLGNIIEIAK
jgi:hypothetical protein